MPARSDRCAVAVRFALAALLIPIVLVATATPTPSAAASQAAGTEASPWEHALWNGATTMMRVYICSHARRAPSWCDETAVLPSNTPLPDPQGPPLTAEDSAWLTFLEQSDPAKFTLKDVAFIKQRALERRDTQAMEILGYLYAQGISVPRNYAEAYRWYGRAYLAGEQRVKPNMDLVWGLLQRNDLEAAVALTREFNALQEGAPVPDAEDQKESPPAPASEADPTGL